MKRFGTLLLICLLLSLPLVSFSSCRKTPADDSTPAPPPDPSPIEQLLLVVDGASEYRIVRGDSAGKTEREHAALLRQAIQLTTGVQLQIITDYKDSKENAEIKEILVGHTNRAESEQLLSTLKDDEYGIAHIGNKLVIVGATEELTATAVNYFLSTYTKYISEENFTSMSELSIPKDLNLCRSFSLRRSVALYVTDPSLSYIEDLKQALSPATDALDVMTLDADVTTIFDPAKYGTVIVAGIDRMPADSKGAIDNYMNRGGRLLTLGGPAYEKELYAYEEEWYQRSEYLFAVVDDLEDEYKTLMFDTSDDDTARRFSRSTDTPDRGYTVKVDDYDLPGSDAQLFHEVENLSSWDNIIYAFAPAPTVDTDGMTALAFWVRAMDDHTPSIYVEFTDQGNSRWITSVDVSEEWEYKILMPSDFKWWHDSATPSSDIPSFNRMKQISIGFAQSGQSISQGHHSYAIAEPTLISAPDIQAQSTDSLVLDSLSPMYELYPVTNAATLLTNEDQVFVTARNYKISSELISCYPGRRGVGFGNERTSRFVPLIEIKDAKGLHSGYTAWMHLFSTTSADTSLNGKREGSILACFSSVSEEFYNADGIAAIVEVVKALSGEAFIVEGGTDEFTYIAEETKTFTAGIHYLQLGKGEGLTAAVTLYDGERELISYTTASLTPTAVRNHIQKISGKYDVSTGRPTHVIATLMQDGKLIDRVRHDIAFWEPTPEDERRYVYIEDGVFKKDGKIVNFFGVNYMPMSGIAEPNGNYFEHYISRGAYDPEVIANDLDHIKDIGMNSVSVFIHNPQQTLSNNMLDLVNQCAARGIYVNMSIRSAYPLSGYNQATAESLIKTLHFDENEWIYAYDTAWEPRLGEYQSSSYIGRKGYDKAWNEWIKVQYGSLENAQKVWGVTLAKTDEGYPYISDAMMDDTTNRYTKVMAAYYRFLDDHISALMQDKWKDLYPVAPHQQFVFRMSMSGSGYRHGGYKPSLGCFDFQSLATSFGYMEPEGYSLNDGEDCAMQIVVANAYARYVQPDSPVVWKEFGRHSWPGRDSGNFVGFESPQKITADYYAYVLEHCYRSYTSGMYAWYYAGGYRINEQSDYGIINPDGSDRPVTVLLREYAPKFINQGTRPVADVYIEVERDNQNGGIYGIYDASIKAAEKAYSEGKFIDFVDAKRDTAEEIVWADEVYREAVGGTAQTGIYPLRYVNGMVKDVEITKENGKTYATITVCNAKQSTWRAGTVSLVSYKTSDIQINYTITEQVDYLEDVTFKIEITGKGNLDLRFSIGGVEFGNLYSVEVK